MKRIFAAVKIEPGDKFMKPYRELRYALSAEHIKWVEEHNVHITLKFFGETSEDLIPGITEMLNGIARTSHGFSFKLSGLGIFGSSYQPKVLWTGIEPADSVAVLMRTISKAMERYGLESDRQNIVPHLTLGRIKFLDDKTLFNKVINKYRKIDSEPLAVTEYLLIESILRKEGPLYLTLMNFPLH